MITRGCRYCVDGCPDSYEINAAGQCAACLDTKIEEVDTCDGCDQLTATDADPLAPAVKRYLVTHHDGGESDVYYCSDCADLARMDWNGETKNIQPFPEAS